MRSIIFEADPSACNKPGLPPPTLSSVAQKQKTPQSMITGYLGALSRKRTDDTRIFNPLVYRLSYQGKQSTDPFGIGANGDAEGARTLDLQRDRLAF